MATVPSHRTQSPKERFLELDVLRFLAAVAVVVYHYKTKYIESLDAAQAGAAEAIYSLTKFGYLGVDLFFMISGFVIFASAFERTPFQFLVSRITRIYPTLWVCATITTVVAIGLESSKEAPTLLQWATSLPLVNRLVGLPFIDGVYWTLIIEIKFYACVFALLVLGLFRRYAIWLPLWLAATALFAITKQPFFMGWFISPEYSAYFIAGICFYLLRRNGTHWLPLTLIAATLPIAAMYAYKLISDFSHGVGTADRWTAVAIVCVFYVAFLFLALRSIALPQALNVLSLGGVTYPLYLLHNRAGKAVYDAYATTTNPLLLLVLIFAGILLLSYVVHLYFERQIADRLKAYLLDCGRRWVHRAADKRA